MSLSLAEAAHATPQGLRQFVAFIRDITKQEQMVEVRAGTVCSSGGVHVDAVRPGPLLQKLQSSTQLLHDVFNAVTDGLIIANLRGDIVSVNHATGLPGCAAGAFYLLRLYPVVSGIVLSISFLTASAALFRGDVWLPKP
jgi:hypothetical protein